MQPPKRTCFLSRQTQETLGSSAGGPLACGTSEESRLGSTEALRVLSNNQYSNVDLLRRQGVSAVGPNIFFLSCVRALYTLALDYCPLMARLTFGLFDL